MSFSAAFSYFIIPIILTLLLVIYAVACFTVKRVSLPKWIILAGAILLLFVWKPKWEKYPEYKSAKEYEAMDAGLKLYFNEKVSEMQGDNSASAEEDDVDDEGDESDEGDENLLPLDQVASLRGNMIAITHDFDVSLQKDTALLEYRINKMLKERGQYTSDPDSLDYVILFSPYWETDYYTGSGKRLSCRTEMAHVYVIDYKKNCVVKRVEFDENKNPYIISVKKHSSSSDRKITLTPDELYQRIVVEP